VNSTLVTTTEAVDKAFYIILGISGLSLLGVALAMLWFVWRYNRRRQPQPLSQKDHNLWLEVVWTIIPTVLVMLMFWYGWEGYLSLRRIPDNAMHVKVSARMWSWLVTYDNGKTADKLYVPVGQPVKVELVAEDVLHSFYVPAFRVKRDTVPGMTNYAWFVAEKAGSYDLFCAEYCGVGHAAMITTVEALPPAEFEAWLQTSSAPAGGVDGVALMTQHGCLGCHSRDGSRLVGPSLHPGFAADPVEVVTGGKERTLARDRAYLERALLDPGADIVETYPPAMPAYAGRLSDAELAAIVDTLLGEEAAPVSAAASAPPTASLIETGAALAAEHDCLRCHSVDGHRAFGPTLLGLYGRERIVRKGDAEQTVVADAAYLERAIRAPSSEIVVGYPPLMPEIPELADREVEALVAWLQSLKR